MSRWARMCPKAKASMSGNVSSLQSVLYVWILLTDLFQVQRWELVEAPWEHPRVLPYLFSLHSVQFSSVQSLSLVRLSATPWIAARHASLSITNSRSSLGITSMESVMPSSDLILCRPLLLLPQSLPASVFFNESTLCMRWPKYWSFSFSIIPFKKIPGLISFRMDWLALLIKPCLISAFECASYSLSILRNECFGEKNNQI